MKKMIVFTIFLAVALCASFAIAADVKKRFSIQEGINFSAVQDVLTGEVALYWGDQPHPRVEKKYGVFKTSKRTNGFMKENEDSCAWAMASALVVLQERAIKEGANAVIEIKSNIQNHEESSATEYSCLVGKMMVNVALKGTVVTVQK